MINPIWTLSGEAAPAIIDTLLAASHPILFAHFPAALTIIPASTTPLFLGRQIGSLCGVLAGFSLVRQTRYQLY